MSNPIHPTPRCIPNLNGLITFVSTNRDPNKYWFTASTTSIRNRKDQFQYSLPIRCIHMRHRGGGGMRRVRERERKFHFAKIEKGCVPTSNKHKLIGTCWCMQPHYRVSILDVTQSDRVFSIQTFWGYSATLISNSKWILLFLLCPAF